MSKKSERVSIRKTSREWTLIDKRIRDLSLPKVIKNDETASEKRKRERDQFNRYLNKKILSLIEDYKRCPECVIDFLSSEKKQRQKFINTSNLDILREISNKSEVPISTILDRIIINPLLIER